MERLFNQANFQSCFSELTAKNKLHYGFDFIQDLQLRRQDLKETLSTVIVKMFREAIDTN